MVRDQDRKQEVPAQEKAMIESVVLSVVLSLPPQPVRVIVKQPRAVVEVVVRRDRKQRFRELLRRFRDRRGK